MHALARRCLAAAMAVLVALSVVERATPVAAASRPPKFDYQLHTLDNGLSIILNEDHSTPIVHVSLWYHVGSKDEPRGRTGFAHLFEHMMFKGSKNVGPEQHTSLVASIGGQSNATTNEDTTIFWNTVPSQYLPMVLWMEADRMATLRVDDATFKQEREVVKEERRMRIDNQPYGRLQEILYDKAFEVHPYKHPVIGSMADLEAATVDNVREFYETYYVPGNATLTIVGDFDSKQALELITQYFGAIPKAARPLERKIPVEPQKTRERRETVYEEWPLPAVIVAYHITYDGDPDSYPLHIVSKVLSDGQSSRIYRRLVYQDRLALAAFGQANLIEHPNLFYAVAIVQPNATPESTTKALIEEIERLKTEPISARELQRAKNQFARDYIIGRESIQQKATHLAHAYVLHNGDVTTADGEFDIFQGITTADVQRVARRFFTPQNRFVLTILPKAAAPGGSPERPR
ncbi:MAG: insulinase family protein [Acidobacteria bacterium]|jgi:zinc protease|nr:insulinase family protein [Acidobacteriota bacterium]